MMASFYDTQLDFIRWLHQFRTPWLDEFFKFLNYFDRWEFYSFLIPAVWVGYHWKPGLRVFYFLMLNGITNGVLKQLFMAPRPFEVDPTLGIIQVSGYGFPSGAAQTVILLSGILLHSYRNRWTWILCINYIFWISLSRVYLGVHVPTDILAGWAIGGILLALYLFVRPSVEKYLEKRTLFQLFLISQAVPLALVFLPTHPIRFCALASSLGLGLCLSRYWNILLNSPKNRKEFLIRAFIGIAGAFLFDFLGKAISIQSAFTQSMIMGLWLTLGANGLLYRFSHR